MDFWNMLFFSDCFSMISGYIILKIYYVDVLGICTLHTFNTWVQTVNS